MTTVKKKTKRKKAEYKKKKKKSMTKVGGGAGPMYEAKVLADYLSTTQGVVETPHGHDEKFLRKILSDLYERIEKLEAAVTTIDHRPTPSARVTAPKRVQLRSDLAGEITEYIISSMGGELDGTARLHNLFGAIFEYHLRCSDSVLEKAHKEMLSRKYSDD